MSASRRRSVSIWVSPGAAHHAEAAALALQVGPGAHQARALVGQARQLHLQPALAGPGAAGEDLQDHAGAVEHLGFPGLLQVALLHRREGVVDDHDIDLELMDQRGHLLDLALTEQGGGREGAQRRHAGVTDLQIERLGQADRFFQPHLRRAQVPLPGFRRVDHERGLGDGRPVDARAAFTVD